MFANSDSSSVVISCEFYTYSKFLPTSEQRSPKLFGESIPVEGSCQNTCLFTNSFRFVLDFEHNNAESEQSQFQRNIEK